MVLRACCMATLIRCPQEASMQGGARVVLAGWRLAGCWLGWPVLAHPHVLAQLLGNLARLQRQLARGDQQQRCGQGGAEEWRAGERVIGQWGLWQTRVARHPPPQPSPQHALTLDLVLAGVHLLQDGDAEGSGLASAVLGARLRPGRRVGTCSSEPRAAAAAVTRRGMQPGTHGCAGHHKLMRSAALQVAAEQRCR